MALPAVDMQNSCCKKQRCLSGPNAGQVYDICDPCQGQGVFDEESCDCKSACYAAGSYRVDYDFTFDYTARLDCGTGSFCTVDCDNNPRIDCGSETVSDSFNYSGGGCLIPSYLPESFDACGEPISAATVSFYNCSESVEDPAAPEAFPLCGSPIYSLSRTGCAPGATGGSVEFEVVDLNA